MLSSKYFDSLPEERKGYMTEMRKMLFRLFPEIKEDMAYNMPTYHIDGITFCALASQKNYMALYIMPHDLLWNFSSDLQSYDHGKSCIRFKKLESHDLNLFRDILTYCEANYPSSEFYGKMVQENR